MKVLNLAAEIEKLPARLLELLRESGRLAEERGQRLLLVGGAVRDLLLGSASFDMDLVVEGDALKLVEELVRRYPGRVVAHSRFGTARVQFGEFSLDFATARSETYSHPGALPKVKPDILEVDLFRRDFTVNTMALGLSPARWGDLIDRHGGREDLERRYIRILHPESFVDDATRIMRAIRYEQRLGFRLESDTARLLRRHRKMLDTISGDRLRREIELILREERPEQVLHRMAELGVLQQIHPSLKGNGWLAQKFPRVRGLVLPARERQTLYLSLLAYHLTPEEGEQLLSRLKAPRVTAQVVRDTLGIKSELALRVHSGLTPGALYRWLRPRRPLAVQANALAGSPLVRWQLELFLRRLSEVKPLLSGEGLKKLGVPSGPEMGRVRERRLDAWLARAAHTRGEEEALVHRWMRGFPGKRATDLAIS